MCSFDVCSLFTNVPLDETIEICLSKLYSLPDPPALPRHVLKTLLEFATKKSHFVFDGHYYDQIDGVAMGSPLGPVLANIFMCDFEQKWLANVDSRPSIWFRYVDDKFSLFDSEATAASFLHFLNTRHPNIKFTMELEENQEIPFLDVRIKRNLNNFTTTVHRKTTFTGLYTKWDSFTPRKYKINLIRTLTYRCLRICSSSSLLQSTLFDLKNTLLQNGYPRGVLCYNINDVLNRQKNSLLNLPPLFLRKISFLSCLFWAFKVKLLLDALNLVLVSFMAVSILGLFFKTLAGLSLFFPTKIKNSIQSQLLGLWLLLHRQNKKKIAWQEVRAFQSSYTSRPRLCCCRPYNFYRS